MIKGKCKNCGKEIIRKGNNQPVFCSLKCKAKWQKEQKPIDEKWLHEKYIVEKLSTYDIAKIIRRNPKRVYEWLKSYSIPTRQRGENLKGEDNYMKRPNVGSPFKGKKHTKEVRKILSEKAKKPRPYLRGKKNGMYGRREELNPNWKGGGSPERQSFYSSCKWANLVRSIWERDKASCQRCGRKKIKNEEFHIHHIKSFTEYPELRFMFNNCVLLCNECHQWVHSKENKEKCFLKEKTKKKFQKRKIYSEEEINKIARENNMITVDCLKDDNQITIEPEKGDTIYEFTRLADKNKFTLTWSEFDDT